MFIFKPAENAVNDSFLTQIFVLVDKLIKDIF